MGTCVEVNLKFGTSLGARGLPRGSAKRILEDVPPKAKPGSKVGGSGEGNGETLILDSRPGKTHIGPKFNSKQLLRRCCYTHFPPFVRKSRSKVLRVTVETVLIQLRSARLDF